MLSLPTFLTLCLGTASGLWPWHPDRIHSHCKNNSHLVSSMLSLSTPAFHGRGRGHKFTNSWYAYIYIFLMLFINIFPQNWKKYQFLGTNYVNLWITARKLNFEEVYEFSVLFQLQVLNLLSVTGGVIAIASLNYLNK